MVEIIAAVFFIGNVLGLVALPRVLSERRESYATLSWVLAIVFVPYLGLGLYALIGSRRIHRTRRVKSRADARLSAAEDAAAAGLAAFARPGREPSVGLEGVLRLADRIASGPATTGNAVKLLIDGEATFDALEAAIRAARHHVHLEYYIFNADRTGARFRDLLAAKAREGVEVRLLLDGTNRVGEDFFAPLAAAGAHIAVFMPIVLSLRLGRNPTLRNHRKIVVVDGVTGFTGGVNIGDEYLAGHRHRKRWRDTHAQIRGPAVHRLQEVFVEDWHFATGVDLVSARYFPAQVAVGDQLVNVLRSGPDEEWQVIHDILFAAITQAEHSVVLTTPYFVPGPAFETALTTAALRGVEVRLLLPRHADHWLMDYAARAFLPDVMRAGVRVFQYGPGMMHAKTAVVDGMWATVGSANMDVRSFRLNFEANLVVHGEAFASELGAAIEADIAEAREVKPRQPNRRDRILLGVARVLAPVL